MSGRHLLPHFLAVALIAGGCLPAYAADDFTPRPQRAFAEKPRIEDYADYNAFLVDIMEYRRQKAEKAQSKAAEAAAVASTPSLPDDTLASVSGQQTVDLRELYQVRDPESLEDALARAKKLPHPVYNEPERFGRTTSYSFPIQPMDGEDMSIREIGGLLQDMESVNPDTFRDNSDQDQASHTLAKNSSNDGEAREAKAIESVDGIFRPFYDIATRILTDSNGNKIWAPMFVDNEAGVTIIRRLDIEVVLKTD